MKISGIFEAYLSYMPYKSWQISGKSGKSQACFRDILGKSQAYRRHSFKEYLSHMWFISLEYLKHIWGIFKKNLSQISEISGYLRHTAPPPPPLKLHTRKGTKPYVINQASLCEFLFFIPNFKIRYVKLPLVVD